jgi:hypothetical protein
VEVVAAADGEAADAANRATFSNTTSPDDGGAGGCTLAGESIWELKNAMA